MNDIKVDKNIPIPTSKYTKYPYGEMEVGDSFFVKIEREKIYSSSSQYGKRHNAKFSVRKEADGYRVWRIS